jgi:hypothetical protein
MYVVLFIAVFITRLRRSANIVNKKSIAEDDRETPSIGQREHKAVPERRLHYHLVRDEDLAHKVSKTVLISPRAGL